MKRILSKEVRALLNIGGCLKDGMRHCLFLGLTLTLSSGVVFAEPEFELLHLWITDQEQYALDAFREPLSENGVEWRDHLSFGNFHDIRLQFADRLAVGLPPEGVFWIGGNDTRNLVEKGIFRLIPEEKVGQFDALYHPDIYSVMKMAGGLSALPVGIHIQNYSIYNVSILNQLDLPKPTNWEQFLTLAPVIQEAGFIPLSISDGSWQLRHLYISILAERMSPDDFHALFGSNVEGIEGSRETLLWAFNIIGDLRPFTDRAYYNMTWDEAADFVFDSKAFLYVIGDFVSALIPDGSPVRCDLFTHDASILWAFDTVALSETSDAEAQEVQKHAIEAFTEPENLTNYVSRKGGVSVLREPIIDEENHCLQISYQAWSQDVERVHVPAEIWSNQFNAIGRIVQRFIWGEIASSEEATEQVIQSLKALSVN